MSIDQATAVKGLTKDRARLIAYIYAIARDWHLAEDLFQDVSALAVEKHDRIVDADHLLLWARKAALENLGILFGIAVAPLLFVPEGG